VAASIRGDHEVSKWKHSKILDVPPDLAQDHRYLARSEIVALPVGVFYKKKDLLTRHRFARFTLSQGRTAFTFEAIDDRGHWRVAGDELARMIESVGLTDHFAPEQALAEVGLDGIVLLPDAPLPEGAIEPPKSELDIEQLYNGYTDMHAQGHFDHDSPDLDRLELLTSWIPEGVRVLDLGCNSGAFGAALIPKGCDVHGVDLSAALVVQANLRGVNAISSFDLRRTAGARLGSAANTGGSSPSPNGRWSIGRFRTSCTRAVGT
jgi:hypothetical protein